MIRRLAVLALLACACRSTGADGLPPGKGLVSFDREPPAGAEVVDAPLWKAGDRFVFEKGGTARLALHVETGLGDTYELVDEASGLALLVGRDLSELGQRDPAKGALERQLDPADFLLSWPLWAGKRWSCHFVSRAPGREDLPLFVTYHADAWEDVALPAGTLRCLRIWRRARVAAQGTFVERVALLWYSPDAGAIARRLDDGLVTELVEYQRQ